MGRPASATRSFIAGLATAGAALACVPPAEAAADVDVGGYHDEALLEAYQELVEGNAGSGIQISLGGSGSSSLASSFTPRFGGFGFPGARTDGVDQGLQLKRSFEPPQPGEDGHDLRIAPVQQAEIGGFEVGWAAIARVDGTAAAEAEGDRNFMVGGELALSGVRLDAGFGDEPGLLGLDGQRMSAGVGYSIGGVGARLGYSLVEDAATPTETSLFTLGSQLALRPGLILQGDLAYAQGEEGDPATAAGLVSLRLRF